MVGTADDGENKGVAVGVGCVECVSEDLIFRDRMRWGGRECRRCVGETFQNVGDCDHDVLGGVEIAVGYLDGK